MRKLFIILSLALIIIACKPAETKETTDTATVRGAHPPLDTATVRGEIQEPADRGEAIPAGKGAVGCDSYLTTAEINAECGTALGTFETGTSTPCDRTYHLTEDTLFAYSVAGPEASRQAYDIAKSTRKTIVENQAQYGASTVFEAIGGLGDDSYKSDAGNQQLNINFIKGGYSVYLIADPGLCTWDKMESLAKKIAGRLP